MTKQYFGTDGIRGTVGQGHITADFMLKLGWAVGKVMAKDNNAKVLIGRDTRISGLILQSALQAGLSSAGVDTHLLGVIPTPAVAHLTYSMRASAGIVISASHNPYYDNGVKFFDAKGMKLSEDIELAIEQQLQQPITMAASDHLGHVWDVVDARGRYVEFCKSTFPSQLNLYGLKIVTDCANGATRDVAPTIFHELGADVIPIFTEADGLSINHQCGATNLSTLAKTVVEQQADLGIAFDGDGDRLIMVDQQGDVVDGDQILCILAKDLVTGMNSRNGVVGTLMSNLGLEQALTDSGIDFTRTEVGDRFVLAELIKRDWTLGGESSGHIVNLDYTTTGDGIITALQVLRIIQMSNQNLQQLQKQMIKRPQVLINVPIEKPVDLSDHPELLTIIQGHEKTLRKRGRILVRPSGTEPYVRIMVEGNEADEVKSIAEDIAQHTKQRLHSTTANE